MAEVLRVSLQGQLPGGEVWSVNPCYHLLTEPPGITASQLLTVATAMNARTISTGITAMMNVGTLITGVRLEARSRAGVLEAQADQPRAVAVPGTGATTHPLQVSIVASLRTGFPGARGRGRLYFPATGPSLVSGSGRFTGPNVNSFILGVKTLLSGFTADILPTLGANDLVVWSRTGTALHEVTSLRAGDVPDVQRRRRDQLVEVYTPTTYP